MSYPFDSSCQRCKHLTDGQTSWVVLAKHHTQQVSYLSHPLSPSPWYLVQQPVSTIYFYDKHKPYYEFTNFARFTTLFRGVIYPTSEHAFQAAKFLHQHPRLAEEIRMASSPRKAFDIAQANNGKKRRHWRSINIAIMEEILWNKFTFHKQLRDLLLNTGNARLVEDSPYDSFWGIGLDRKGRNELGKALERVRSRLRNLPV